MSTARLITLGVGLFIIFVPNFMDWGPSHIFNEEWTGHARLHTVWQLAMQTAFAIAAATLAWRGKVKEGAVINLIILGSFFVAVILNASDLFDGSFTDMTDGSTKVGGVDGNLLAFSILISLQTLGFLKAAKDN